MEGETPSADHHETVTSSGPSGGEDLHRQVRNPTTFNLGSKLIIRLLFIRWLMVPYTPKITVSSRLFLAFSVRWHSLLCLFRRVGSHDVNFLKPSGVLSIRVYVYAV